MKILNLYAGIGGNRKLWQNADVTAVEINPSIAAIYKDFYPNDKMIIGNAHEYLIEHYNEFDFIWSSPPCPTHSKTNFFNHIKPRFPDMQLYEEVIFLQHFAKAGMLWIVENVKSYYEPLVKPQETARHFLWSNFKITDIGITKKVRNDAGYNLAKKMEERGIIITDFHGYKGDKRQLLNNAIEPELGLHIMNCALGSAVPEPIGLFENESSK